jgi:hypothetical protein
METETYRTADDIVVHRVMENGRHKLLMSNGAECYSSDWTPREYPAHLFFRGREFVFRHGRLSEIVVLDRIK